MKRFFAFAFSLLILLIAAAVIVPSFIDWSAYKDQAAQVVREKAGLDLVIKGKVGFSLIPTPRLYVEEAALNTIDEKPLVAFERLEVNVELAPLFNKQVKVSSLTLVKPQIALEKLHNGKLNIMTPEIETLSNGEKSGAVEGQAIAQTPAFDMSLDEIRIKDGVFTYTDTTTRKQTKVQYINMDLSAQSLAGPFDARGSMFYEGRGLNVDAKIARYDSENKLISSKVKLVLQPGDINIEYDGVVSLEGENGASLQGQTKIYVEDITRALAKQGIKPQQLEIKSGAFSAKGLLTADTKFLSYKDVAVKLNQQALSSDLLVTLSPLSYDLTLNTLKDSQLDLTALLTNSYGFKKSDIQVSVSGKPQKVMLKSAVIKLDDMTMSVSGSYEAPEEKRAQLSLNAKMSKLDYDKLLAIMPESPAKGSGGKAHPGWSLQENAGPAELPMDVTVTAEIDELIWQKKKIKNITTKVRATQNRVILDTLKIEDLGKANLKASGEIWDIAKLEGITAYLDLDSPDIKELANWMAVDTSAWPQKVKKANIKIKATGSSQVMDMTANVASLDGKLIAGGKINNPLSKPAFSNLELQIKHDNMAQALQMFTGADISDKNLRKSLDFYTKVSQAGKIYTLEGIKGSLSGTSVEGTAELDLSGKTPNIKAELNLGTIKLESVVNKKTKTSSSTNKTTQSSGTQRWSKEAINASAFHAANLDLKVSARAIDYGAWPLSEPKMTLKLKNGVLEISDLAAGIFGGQISAASGVQVANEERALLHFESTSTFSNVDLGQLSKALIGTKLVDISGTGSMDLSLETSGVSPAALIYDLGGQGKVEGSNILLKGVDVAKFVRALSDETKPGDTLLGVWKGSTKGGQTMFETLIGAFTIQNGVVNISSMTLDGQTAKVETTGKIDLPKWMLSTKHPMSVKGTDAEGAPIPPFEISFSGPLDNPSQTFGQGLLQDYLQRKIQRKLNKLLTEKLGLPGAHNNTNNNAPGTNTPSEQPAGETTTGQQSQESNMTPATGASPAPESGSGRCFKGCS